MPAPTPMRWPPRIEGTAFSDLAVAMAGLLAERGVQSIVISRAGREIRRHARATDLPAALAEHAPCTLRFVDPAGDAELRYRVTADSITMEPPQGPPAS